MLTKRSIQKMILLKEADIKKLEQTIKEAASPRDNIKHMGNEAYHFGYIQGAVDLAKQILEGRL